MMNWTCNDAIDDVIDDVIDASNDELNIFFLNKIEEDFLR